MISTPSPGAAALSRAPTPNSAKPPVRHLFRPHRSVSLLQGIIRIAIVSRNRVMTVCTPFTSVFRSLLMSPIITFMFDPAKLQMNWASASGAISLRELRSASPVARPWAAETHWRAFRPAGRPRAACPPSSPRPPCPTTGSALRGCPSDTGGRLLSVDPPTLANPGSREQTGPSRPAERFSPARERRVGASNTIARWPSDRPSACVSTPTRSTSCGVDTTTRPITKSLRPVATRASAATTPSPSSWPSAGGNHREAPDELRTTLPARSTGRPGSPSARTMRSSECKC